MKTFVALAALVSGVVASNSTNTTSTTPGPTTSTTPVPDVMCNPIPTFVGAGMQNPTCCDAQKTLVSYGVMTDPLKESLRPLITSCLAYGGLCENTTAGNFTPTATAKAWAAQVVCTPNVAGEYYNDCVPEWMNGLNSNKANYTLNGLLLDGGNYSAVCLEFHEGAILANSSTPVIRDAVFASTAAIEASTKASWVVNTTQAPASNTSAPASNATETTSNATEASATNATEEVKTITGSLTVSFSVPANATAASLNNDTSFKTALAKSIKASLPSLPTAATVTVTSIAAARRRALSARRLSGSSLDLKVDYSISVPAASADAVFTDLSDSATFAAAVKTASVAEFTSAGLTGYAVESVTAVAPTCTGCAVVTTTASAVLDDAPSSAFATGAASAVAMAFAAFA